MSSQVRSRHLGTSNIDGRAGQQICSGKCSWRLSEIRYLHQAIFFKFLLQAEFFANKLSIMMQRVTLWNKLYLIYNFFFVRKIIGHILTSVFYCLVIPTTVFVPEIEIPRWGYVYIPTIITLLNAVGTPRCQSSKHLFNSLNNQPKLPDIRARNNIHINKRNNKMVQVCSLGYLLGPV